MSLRIEALNSFKALLKARQKVFRNDQRMLFLSRNQIFEEFRKNRHVTDSAQIKDMIEGAKEASRFLVYGIAQAIQGDSNNYNVQLNTDQVKEFIDQEVKFGAIGDEFKK